MYFKTIDVVSETLNKMNSQAQQRFPVYLNKQTW
jgi:hypothetical protein